MRKPAMPLVQLVPPACSVETVQTLEFLLNEAKAGRVVGLAYIALQPGHRYDIDVTGEAGQDPEFVLGLTRVLETQLEKIIGSR